MTKFLKTNLLVFIILSFMIMAVFGQLTQTFYQQDEWFSLGAIFAQGPSTILNGVWNPIDFLFVKGRVLSSAVGFIFLNYFPLQNTQLAIFAILTHIIATCLIYFLINKFLKNTLISLFGASFFAVNGVSHGAVTWPVIAINTVTSTILILIGIFSFFKYLGNPKLKWLVLTGLLVYFSLWFKETGIYLFLFLPFSALLFKKYSFKSFFRYFWLFVLPFILIVTYRIILLKSVTTNVNLYITGENQHFFETLLFRSILYPLTSFSLMFVPGNQFLSFAREILREIYPFFASAGNNILIAQSVILDLLAVILTGIILMFIFILLQKETFKIKRIVYFWLIFTLMSFLPYILQGKDFSYLESRYYYLSMVGGAMLFSWVLKRLREVFGQKVFHLFILPLCMIFLVFHAGVVKNSIAEKVKIANLQKSFISQLKTLVPKLDKDRNVFYTTSDQNFWAEGNKLPFQQGSGYTMMILYYDSGKIPRELLKAQSLLENGFLFDIGSQGYREVGQYGFGYFWDKKKLEEAIKLHNLPEKDIIELQYSSDTNILRKVK